MFDVSCNTFRNTYITNVSSEYGKNVRMNLEQISNGQLQIKSIFVWQWMNIYLFVVYNKTAFSCLGFLSENIMSLYHYSVI